MKYTFSGLRSFLFPVLFLIAVSGSAQAVYPAEQAKNLASRIAQHFQKNETAQVYMLFSADLASKLSEQAFEQTWKSVQQQAGTLKTIGPASVQLAPDNKNQLAIVPLQFEKAALDLSVAVNAQGKLEGIFITPAKTDATKTTFANPPYADKSEYTERQVTVQTGEYKLPGILTLPKGKTKVPIVVLVHGSGPQDLDLTVGPNKPFRDLALGLAAQGVATLRYDKRTFVYPAKVAENAQGLTVQEETIDDAISAIALAKRQPEVNPGKVFLLGHSMGAMLAPRIAKSAPELAGLILFAAPARPMEDLILDQFIYLLEKEKNQQNEQLLNQIREQVATVKSMNLNPNTPSEQLPLGLPAAYWIDLRGYNPVYEARNLPQRLMVLHGERDYQVTNQDFELWQAGLKGRGRQFTPVSYRDLNHLMLPGKGPGTPAEYQQPGHVPEYVIDGIARWIKIGL